MYTSSTPSTWLSRVPSRPPVPSLVLGSSADTDVIVVDSDGVLVDFDAGFRIVAADVVGAPVPLLNTFAYDLTVRYGLTRQHVRDVFEAMRTHPSGWGNLPAMPGAAHALQRLKAWGYTVHCVTAIDETCAEARWKNFANLEMVPDALHCVGFGGNKRAVLEQLNPVAVVEDRLEVLMHHAAHVPARAWIDLKHDQGGHVLTEDIMLTSSLGAWVDAWEQLLLCHQDFPPSRVVLSDGAASLSSRKRTSP